MKVNNKILKTFWINELDNFKTIKGVADSQLTDGVNWKTNLEVKTTFNEVIVYAMSIYEDIQNKTTHRKKYWEKSLVNNLTELMESLRNEDRLNTNIWDIMLDYGKQITNHSCSNCSHTDYDTIKAELGQYKLKWDSHNCSPNSPADYDTIKSERDQLKTKNEEMREKLIADCKLGLDKSNSLEQIITKINELTKNPNNTEREREITALKQEKEQLATQIKQKDQTIADLQKPNNQTITEIKEKIRVKGKEIGIDNQTLEKSLQEAQSYQQLVELEQKFFTEKVAEKDKFISEANKNKSSLKGWLMATSILLGVMVVGVLVAVFVSRSRKKAE